VSTVPHDVPRLDKPFDQAGLARAIADAVSRVSAGGGHGAGGVPSAP
jgi:hypothetical protein